MHVLMIRHSNGDVSESEAEVIIYVTPNCIVCCNNLLDIHIDEVVKRVNVLFDQTSQLEEGWHKFPLFLYIENSKLCIQSLTSIALIGRLIFAWLFMSPYPSSSTLFFCACSII